MKHILLIAFILLVAFPAAADVGPFPEEKNACGTEGAACDNAGADENLPGMCESTTAECVDATTCLRCFEAQPEEEDEANDEEADESCAVSGPGRDGGILGAMVLLGAASVLLSRRRS